MILQRLLMAIVAGAAMAAAAVIATVALAVAIFGFARPSLGPANAAAIVAAVFAALIGVAGFLAARGAGWRGGGRLDEREAMSLADRLMDMARDRPLVAVGVALALGLVLMRNPKSLGAIARAFFESLGGVRPPAP